MPEFEAGTFTIGTLLGMIIGAFLGHALAIRRGRFQVKHNAAIAFRKRLMPAILDIERGKNPVEVIVASFPTHYEAAREYAVYLQGSSLEKFKAELNEYKRWHKVVCNRSSGQRVHEKGDSEYLEMKEVGPLKYLKDLIKHANI